MRVVVAFPRAAWLTCAASIAACGGDAPGVRLVPVGDGPCGRPAGARSLLVTPLGDFPSQRRSVALGAPVSFADLPADTRQLAVEVLGDGAEVLAQGKTAPFVLGALDDGDTLTVAMAPPDSFCPGPPLLEARDRPLVAAAGGGVLIAGGHGPAPLASAEWLDPAGASRVVELPPGFAGPLGLAGSSLVPLADGTVALVGGPSPGFAVYDPASGTFGDAQLVNQVRAHAAAVALDDGRIMLLGGCGTLDPDGSCEAGGVRSDSRFLDLATGAITVGPDLIAERARPTGFLERRPDGRQSVVVVGGVDNTGMAVTTAERVDLESGAVTVLAGAGAAAARTDSGAIITAFAPDLADPHGDTAVLVPGADSARALPPVPLARSGVVLVTQEDGLVIGLGDGPPLRYLPSAGTWSVVLGDGNAPALDGGHAAVRLDDGSVLVVGGRLGIPAAVQRTTWRFRPRLLGPYTGSLSVVPGDDESDPPLAPLDPAQVTPGPPWRLAGPGHAIVGGLVGGRLIVDLIAAVPASGAGLLLGHRSPADHHLVRLVPGLPAALERLVAGSATTLCQGSTVPAAGMTAVTLNLDGGAVRVAMSGQVVLSCDVERVPDGRIGVASIGSGEVEVMSIAVSRP